MVVRLGAFVLAVLVGARGPPSVYNGGWSFLSSFVEVFAVGFLPVFIATSVLRSRGLLPDGRAVPVKGGGGGAGVGAPAVVLSVVAVVLCAATIVAGACSRDWVLCAVGGVLVAVNGGLLYWFFKE